MKQTLIAVALLFALLACKKEKEQPATETKQAYAIRIEAAGTTIYHSNLAYYSNVNGGQSNENELSKIVYLAYTNGSYMVELANKQGCGIDFDLNWLKKDTTIHVPALSTITIQLPGAALGGQKIKAKPLYRCGNSGGDLGHVEVETPLALPVKFKSIRAEKVGKDKLKVIFEVTECEGINAFYVQLQKNWGEFKTVAVVFPDETQPNRQYSVTISL